MKKIIIIAVLLFAGCATTQNVDVSVRSRIYHASFSQTMKGIIDYLNDRGWQIQNVDKEYGIINTEYRTNSGILAALEGQLREKITTSVSRVDSNSSKVIATILNEKLRGWGWSSQGSTESFVKQMYDSLFIHLQPYIER
jgi:ABC-type uncharacterized transport system substrate-binding protein